MNPNTDIGIIIHQIVTTGKYLLQRKYKQFTHNTYIDAAAIAATIENFKRNMMATRQGPPIDEKENRESDKQRDLGEHIEGGRTV